MLLVLGVIFFLVVVPLVGLLVGLPTWWLFAAKPRQFTLWRGIFLGIFGGIVAHPLVWICCSLVLSVVDVINLTPHLMSNFSSNLPVILPVDLLLVVPLSVLRIVLVGWITVAIGGIAGGLLVHLQAALMRRVRLQDGIVPPPIG